MENNATLPLAEPLTLEKKWQQDGITVLRAHASLPQLGGTSRHARRFDRYYALIGRAFLARAEKTLFPRAAKECRDAMERSAPWQVSTASLHYEAAVPTETLLSIILTFRSENEAVIFRRAEVWDSAQMLPIPLSEWFPPHTNLRHRAGKSGVPDSSEARFRFPLSGYLPTERGLCLLGKNGGTCLLPYEETCGPFPPAALSTQGSATKGLPSLSGG